MNAFFDSLSLGLFALMLSIATPVFIGLLVSLLTLSRKVSICAGAAGAGVAALLIGAVINGAEGRACQTMYGAVYLTGIQAK